jgi:hypothetical protein
MMSTAAADQAGTIQQAPAAAAAGYGPACSTSSHSGSTMPTISSSWLTQQELLALPLGQLLPVASQQLQAALAAIASVQGALTALAGFSADLPIQSASPYPRRRAGAQAGAAAAPAAADTAAVHSVAGQQQQQVEGQPQPTVPTLPAVFSPAAAPMLRASLELLMGVYAAAGVDAEESSLLGEVRPGQLLSPRGTVEDSTAATPAVAVAAAAAGGHHEVAASAASSMEALLVQGYQAELRCSSSSGCQAPACHVASTAAGAGQVGSAAMAPVSSSSSQQPFSVQCRSTLAQNSCASLQRLATPTHGLWAHLRHVLADTPHVSPPCDPQERDGNSREELAAAVTGAPVLPAAAGVGVGASGVPNGVQQQQQQQQQQPPGSGVGGPCVNGPGQVSGGGVCVTGRLSQLVAQQLLRS